MKKTYAPGCALMIYKPHLAQKVLDFLTSEDREITEHTICCHFDPKIKENTEIINTCPGCNKRFRELYENVTTLSLWERLADHPTFPFPDYKGQRMAVLDACPTRHQVVVHQAIRTLLARMNIQVVEPERTGVHGLCCGDSYFGKLPPEQVKEQMKKRASEMPEENVVVYCVSCCKSMHIGGKKPRYIVDLLFEEETLAKTFEPEDWHREIDEFMKCHKD